MSVANKDFEQFRAEYELTLTHPTHAEPVGVISSHTSRAILECEQPQLERA